MTKGDFIPHSDSEFLIGHGRFKVARRTTNTKNDVPRTVKQGVRTMTRQMKLLVMATSFAGALFGLGQVSLHAGPAVYYSFNTTNAIADIGSSISAFSYQNSSGLATNFVTGTTQNVQPGFQAGRSISQDHWVGDTNFFQFTLNASSLQDIVVLYAWERSSTGPTNAVFQYSLTGAGGVFVNFATNFVPTSFTSAGSVVTQDFSAVSALDDDSTIAFRIVGVNVGAASGAMHLDNFTVNAVGIPEPSVIMLVEVGLVALLIRRMCRS